MIDWPSFALGFAVAFWFAIFLEGRKNERRRSHRESKNGAMAATASVGGLAGAVRPEHQADDSYQSEVLRARNEN